MSNKEVISQFYSALAAADIEKMLECYHNDVVFEDPAFGTLKEGRPHAMWKMLVARGKGNMKISFSNVSCEGNIGSANWEAHYVYGKKKRPVHNMITAQFEFKDGKIIKHTDTFDLWAWTRQALGFGGRVLGWSSHIKKKIQASTNEQLDEYLAKK